MKRFNLILGTTFIAVVVLGACLSFVWLPYDPNALDFAVQLAAPSLSHPLGTDHFGRDLLSRLLVGSRATLYVGFIAVGIALGLGCALGAVAGFLGGVWDEMIMRVVDTLYAFPAILMALLLGRRFHAGNPDRYDRHRAGDRADFRAHYALVGVVLKRTTVSSKPGGHLGCPRGGFCCATFCPTRSPPFWCKRV